MSLKVVTFGCRLNTYESEVIKRNAEAAGLKNAVIFNSCAVTEEAEKKLCRAIRKIKNRYPSSKIMVTGCAVQINPYKYKRMDEVDYVFGNIEKLKLSFFENLVSKSTEIAVNDIMSVKDTAHQMIDKMSGRSRAFLQIQNGCNHRCTFCIIPFGRGNSRSVPLDIIVQQAKNMIRHGYKEFVLTGVDITDYGSDLPEHETLGSMLRKLMKLVPQIKRLRLSSIDVAEIDDELINVILNEEKFMPYLHLSLQSGDDMILKRMKRRHRRYHILDFKYNIIKNRPDIIFGADLIAGFPTESEQMFQNTFELVRELPIVHLHVFPYSSRPGTPAARMPQLDNDVIIKRAKTLRLVGKSLLDTHLRSKIGSFQKVLIEQNGYGFTEDFCRVKIDFPISQGNIVSLRINDVIDNCLITT